MKIRKRDGRIEAFDQQKIADAVAKAIVASGWDDSSAGRAGKRVAAAVVNGLMNEGASVVDIEHIQDVVEECMMARESLREAAKRYILYRKRRTDIRTQQLQLSKAMRDLTFTEAAKRDGQRENANVDANAPMGTMLKYGSEAAKDFYLREMISPKIAEAHIRGDIHIHDLDFYGLTTTCTQISLKKLFKGGFFTGHGYVREPNSIGSYAALACIAIQANQNDQHGGQSIPMFEYDLAPGVVKTFRKEFMRFGRFLGLIDEANESRVEEFFRNAIQTEASVLTDEAKKTLANIFVTRDPSWFPRTWAAAVASTEKAVYQAMEALIHNLNTMSSRAGAQVPFSSINYGTGTTPEQRMVIAQCLEALDAGLGNGETSIFPIHVFKTKKGVNFEEGDPNYDLFLRACEVSAKRLFPNFTFLDAPFNLQFYEPGNPDSEVATMGCRTRVMANVNGPQLTSGRGNLSFTTINLPRLAIEANKCPGIFMERVKEMGNLVVEQLLERFEVQAARHVYNYPFLMSQGVWRDSEKLSSRDEVREVLKHGTLTIGFIGLAEALVALFGKHHGEDAEVREFALRVVKALREITDKATKEHHLNFSLIATPAEGLSGRFVRIDRKNYGVIPGVTDRDYYTNSFHVPVYYDLPVWDKIAIEAPYHDLCNGGHITYVELDGDLMQNRDAFVQIIKYMGEQGIGYGSVNHPVDYDPVCGFSGVIKDKCPKCGRKECEPVPGQNIGEGVKFNHIRRITGYLVGDVESRFNDAKRAEEKDRVKHGLGRPA